MLVGWRKNAMPRRTWPFVIGIRILCKKQNRVSLDDHDHQRQNVLLYYLSRSNPSWLFFFASPTVQASMYASFWHARCHTAHWKSHPLLVLYAMALKCLHSLILLLALWVKVGHFYLEFIEVIDINPYLCSFLSLWWKIKVALLYFCPLTKC